MKQYVVSKEFKKLNIGLALDEGLASPTEVMPVYYGERNVFWVRFHCTGSKNKIYPNCQICCNSCLTF